MPTLVPKESEIERKWFIVDADGQVLGRLASRIASILRGKHKQTFVPHLDVGDHVVVVNAAKVHLTGRKMRDKQYRWHSGYIGGLREVNAETMIRTHPEHGRPVRHLRDGRGRWSHGPGRRRPPRVVARAGALRRQVPTSAQEGGPPHARPADARAQEVRPARRAAKVPVLEAVVGAMVRVAVAGASGYMGAELLRLLCVHPDMP